MGNTSPAPDEPDHRVGDLPRALEDPAVLSRLGGRGLALFLDYDGTLTPIAPRPEDAVLSDAMRRSLTEVARRWPVAVLTGRDLADVRSIVGLDGLTYAGSHGFDIHTADGRSLHQRAELAASLDAPDAELRGALEAGPPGAWVERKRFALAVHYRQVEPSRLPEVERAVQAVAAAHPNLRRTGGKMVFELRPDVDWDKGTTLVSLLEILGLGRPDVLPIAIGDDETDEDAFRALRGRGWGIVVGTGDDRRPTFAEHRLDGPEEVRVLLERLASLGPGQ
jgi:trehalose 6-phosphate phosphatase